MEALAAGVLGQFRIRRDGCQCGPGFGQGTAQSVPVLAGVFTLQVPKGIEMVVEALGQLLPVLLGPAEQQSGGHLVGMTGGQGQGLAHRQSQQP